MKYSLIKYQLSYPDLALQEKSRILGILPQARIEHFGSTAVLGLGGKGIIDLYVLLPRDEMENASSQLCNRLGYDYRKSGGDDERLFHQRTDEYDGNNFQVYHAHLSFPESNNVINAICFRDALRSNPQLVHEYEQIKKQAIVEASKFRDKQSKKNAYMRVKTPFIEKVLHQLS